MSKRYSLRELELMMPDRPGQIRLGMLFATNHQERLRWVNAAIDHIARELSKTPQYRKSHSEDALSIEVINILKAMGFQASHDQAIGGHCDILIEAKDDFLWIGEAKLHSSYDHLYEGFQQLDTRYATGMTGQDAGGIIIYSRNQRIDQMMKRWEECLKQRRPDVTTTPCGQNDLAFLSTHAHVRTGRQFVVRHVPISLYFDPQDHKHT